MDVAGDSHVTLPFYCRQRILCERVFQRNSRIAQEWITDSLSRSEKNQLTFIESEPSQKRLATARSISRTSSTEKHGQLLPVSFHSYPAKRKHDTEDALAVVNKKGKPHLMITMTCNPLWPEIVQNLLPGQQASDRPDLCCRVFKIKLAVLMSHLKSGNVLGPYDYRMSVIEYQKRGLSPAHVIVKFKNAGPDVLNQMDSWVSAQLPDASIAGGKLREMVLKYMIHKPCGHHNVDAPCMQTNRDTNTKSCNKYCSQPFRTTATFNERSGRAECCRTRNGGYPTIRNKVGNSWVDVPVGNQWVVPYNPYLLILLDCHVCTNVVSAASCAKYLYKYIAKGNDFAKARIAGIKSEIEMYRTTRYISATEATWRMLGFGSHSRFPTVTRVHAHLEDKNNVLYPAEASAEEHTAIAQHSTSDLLRYLKRPTAARFTALTLLSYFETYIVTKKKKADPIPISAPPGKWVDQYGNTVSLRTTEHVCRILFKSPAVGDVFYLRLLLHKIPARTFAELRTVHPENGPSAVYSTFHDAARARGLVPGDQEYFICMKKLFCSKPLTYCDVY